jgi:DNA-binding beta-propeller fold protein YncE
MGGIESPKRREVALVGLLVALLCCTALFAATDPASALVGDLTPAGCISATGTGGCQLLEGIERTFTLQISPDGKNVYASGKDAVLMFSRGTGGALTYMGCVGNTGGKVNGPASCSRTAEGLETPRGIAVSPDGTSVYVVGFTSNAVVEFERTATGELVPRGCYGNDEENGAVAGPTPPCKSAEGLHHPDAIVVSPDGKNVYTTGEGSNAVDFFARSPDGELNRQGCVSNREAGREEGSPSCAFAEGLDAPESVAISPDGTTAYTTSSKSNAVDVFERVAGNGVLNARGCVGNISNDPAAKGPPSCIGAEGLQNPDGIVLSPDGGTAYVNALESRDLAVFARTIGEGVTNGELAPLGCVGNASAEFPGPAGCATTAAGLEGPFGVAVSPDDGQVYVTGGFDNSVSTFTRESNGLLTARGCIGNNEGATPDHSGCSTETAGLGDPIRAVVSPDGLNVYAVSNNAGAIVWFNRAVPLVNTGPPIQPPGSGTKPAVHRTTSTTIGNERLTLTTTLPGRCLKTSASLQTSLSAAKLANAGAGKATLLAARFFLDRGVRHVHHRVVHSRGHAEHVRTVTYTPNRVKTKLPATVSLRLAGLKPGQHVLRVLLVVHKAARVNGDTHVTVVRKTLTQAFAVC